MTTPNFFEGMSAEEQVRALTGMVFEHVRRYYDHSDRTNDLVCEAIEVLQWLRVPIIRYYGEQVVPSCIDKHVLGVIDHGSPEWLVTSVDIESARGADDTARKFCVTLNPDDRDETERYFNSVYDFMPVLVGIGYLAKTYPGRPVTWDDLAAVVDYAGSSEPITPWVWEWAFKAGAGSDN